jgi:TolC family type I secretion outer membrane protein
MKYFFLFLTFFRNVHSSNIEQTLQHVLVSNPDVKIATENINIAKQRVKNAWSNFKPQIQANYTRGRKNEEYGVTEGNFDINEIDVTVTQPVFNGLKDYYKLNEEYTRQELIKTSTTNRVQTILLSAAIAHIRYATEKIIYDISKESENAHRHHFYKISTKQSHGLMTKADLRLAQARLANASSDKEISEINFFRAKQNYIELVGKDENVQLPKLKELPYKNLQLFIKDVLKNNLELRQRKSNVTISELGLKQNRADYFPTVSIQAQYQNDKTQSVFRSTNGSVVSAAVNITLPLYDGGRRYSQINQSISQKIQAKHAVNSMHRRVNNLAKSTWFNLSKSKSIVTLRERATARSKGTFYSFQEQYKAGIRETQDLLDAQREMFNNQIQEARAKESLLVSYYNALHLLGQIK